MRRPRAGRCASPACAVPRPALRRLLALLATAAAVLVAVLAPAAPASAHAVLLRTSPDSGAILPDAPARVTLTFNEPVRLVSQDIDVVGPDGRQLRGGRPTVTGDGSVVHIPLPGNLLRGTFLVSYRIISADSHPVAGGFSFSIGAPSKVAPAATGGTGAAEDPVVAVAMPVTRYLGFAGLALLVGPVLVLMSLWPRRLTRRGPARMVWLGVGLVACSTIAELLLQGPYSTGGGLLSISEHGLMEVLNTRFGWAHVARLVVLVAAVPLVAIVTGEQRHRLAVGERIALLVMATFGVGTWGYGGHPGTSPAPAVTVLSDAVHVAGMSVWLGGLLMLVGFLLPRARTSELAAVLPVWSRWAGWSVGLLAVAGVAQACLQLGSVSALTGTTYGQLIIVKVVAFGIVLVVASRSRAQVHRRVVARAQAPRSSPTPSQVPVSGADESAYPDTVWDEVYGGESGGSDPVERPADPEPSTVDRPVLRRLILVEVAIAALILGFTAVLVQTTPARSAQRAVSQQQNLPFSKTLHSNLFSMQVQVDPARRGRNTVHLIAYHPSDGRPVRVLEWHATASLPGGGIGPVDIPVEQLSDNHVVGDVVLPRAGNWKLAVTARVSEIDEATVTTTVPVH